MTDSFTFSLSPLDTETLLPQLAAALEKRVELHSRQRLPGLWQVTDKLSNAKKDLCIMHPLPRVNEISVSVDDDPRACYFKQVLYGKYMRMALIMKLLGV